MKLDERGAKGDGEKQTHVSGPPCELQSHGGLISVSCATGGETRRGEVEKYSRNRNPGARQLAEWHDRVQRPTKSSTTKHQKRKIDAIVVPNLMNICLKQATCQYLSVGVPGVSA